MQPAVQPAVQPTVRPAEPEDLLALGALIPAAVRALSAGFYSTAQIESAIVHVFGPDSQLIHDRTYYVAVAGPIIVGCGGWSKRNTLFGGDQAKPSLDPLIDPATSPARIRAFFVDPRWARRGLASAILDACSAAARQEGFRALELVATLPGIPFYAAAGFRTIERFELNLPDGVHLPVARMRKALEAQP